MDQKEFNRLTELCDSVLKQFAHEPSVIAIPWLHLLNGHPNSTGQYIYAFKKRSVLSVTGIFIYAVLYKIYKTVTSIIRFNPKLIAINENADVLFISHLVSLEESKADKDFYYGTLPVFLEKEKGLHTITGLIDHTPSDKSFTQKKSIEEKGLNRFLFPKTLSVSKEIGFGIQSFRSFRKLSIAGSREKDPERKKILREAALHALSPETANALRIQALTKYALEKTGARNLVITWEGRSWERLTIQAARFVNTSIKCIGYQHTVLLASSHALKRSLGKEYDPDIICTLGEATAELISASNTFADTKILPFGSYRMGGNIGGEKPVTQNSKCLVAPEGIESESYLLFGFAIELAKQLPETQFIFRTHPVLPYQWIAGKYPSLKDLPANCHLSELANINDDFLRCDLLLYRGSSVAIYAVLNGLKPCYYSIPGEISIDPLYMLGNWRAIVEDVDQFTAILAAGKKISANERTLQFDAAFSICKKYVQIPDEELFNGVIFSIQSL